MSYRYLRTRTTVMSTARITPQARPTKVKAGLVPAHRSTRYPRPHPDRQGGRPGDPQGEEGDRALPEWRRPDRRSGPGRRVRLAACRPCPGRAASGDLEGRSITSRSWDHAVNRRRKPVEPPGPGPPTGRRGVRFTGAIIASPPPGRQNGETRPFTRFRSGRSGSTGPGLPRPGASRPPGGWHRPSAAAAPSSPGASPVRANTPRRPPGLPGPPERRRRGARPRARARVHAAARDGRGCRAPPRAPGRRRG